MGTPNDGLGGPHVRYLGRKEILEAAKYLPSPERECIEFLFEHGLTIGEIADALALDVATTAEFCGRARSLIEQLLKVGCQA